MSPSRRILIVDDEPNVRLVFRTALESAGDETSTAGDGETALEVLERAPADLIVLDLHMPGLSGMEVLQRIRDAGNEVPVIFVTARGRVPNVAEAMRLGAIDYLAKPPSPDALRELAAEVLERHAPHPEVAARPAGPGPVAGSSPFDADLIAAKRALNHRSFDEAEAHLRRAIGQKDDSAEGHNLMGVLHEMRDEHDASYREYKAALKADRHYEPARQNLLWHRDRFDPGLSDVLVDLGDL